MLPVERRQQILSRIHQDGKIEIEALAEELNVTGTTIRRDLAVLEKDGVVMRTHGGAVAPNALIPETPYQKKAAKHTDEKNAIAQIAADLIPENSKILLDSGTTTLEIAKKIKWRDDLVIVTNDARISIELLDSGSQVICTGGNLQRGVGSYLGPHVEHLLTQIQVDMLFLGAHAIHRETGVTAPTMEKAWIKKLMMKAARQAWVVSDSSKFSKQAFAQVCSLEEVTGVITDEQLSLEEKKAFEEVVTTKYAGVRKD